MDILNIEWNNIIIIKFKIAIYVSSSFFLFRSFLSMQRDCGTHFRLTYELQNMPQQVYILYHASYQYLARPGTTRLYIPFVPCGNRTTTPHVSSNRRYCNVFIVILCNGKCVSAFGVYYIHSRCSRYTIHKMCKKSKKK